MKDLKLYQFSPKNWGFGKPPTPIPSLTCSEGSSRIYYVKGTNGSGKSTIPTQICLNEPAQELLLFKNKTVRAMICHSYRIAFVGRYDKTSNCGGADTVSDFEEMETIVHLLCEHLPGDYDIFFEGILPSTIFETWITRLQSFNKETVVVYHKIDDDLAIERVLGRNGGEQSSKLAGLIKEKNKRIRSHIERYPSLFPEIPIFEFDMNAVSFEAMKEQFQQMRGTK